jgi:hypothetical protein
MLSPVIPIGQLLRSRALWGVRTGGAGLGRFAKALRRLQGPKEGLRVRGVQGVQSVSGRSRSSGSGTRDEADPLILC